MAKNSVQRRVYVHVGVPKSGTTFLQTSLSRNTKALKQAGVLYPGSDERMFRAAVDVRGSHKAWGRKSSAVDGAWDDLANLARKHAGTTVISHELLAGARPREVIRAMSMLKGLDVHLVVTARDPARQATAEWQEGIKHGRHLGFEQFRRRVLDGDSDTDYAQRFRAAQDLPDVLGRWGAGLSPDHVHVVCCPPAQAPRELLWERFAGALGLDSSRFPAAGEESRNASLGANEIDLLRRVNLALDKRMRQPDYGILVKRLFAQHLLAATTAPRPVAPADMHDDLTMIAERWVKEIDKAGYAVHGSLSDLMPVAPAAPHPHPDVVDPGSQVETATRATAELLLEVQRGRTEVARLEADNERLRKKRKSLKRRLRKATTD